MVLVPINPFNRFFVVRGSSEWFLSSQVYQQFEVLERNIDQELEQIAKLRCIKTDAKNEALGDLRAARQWRRDKMAAYSQNRDFSR